jgi:hypothetical protein
VTNRGVFYFSPVTRGPDLSVNRHSPLMDRRAKSAPEILLSALGTVPSQIEPETSLAQQSDPLWRCPKCGGPMVVIERLTAAQIQLRSPPHLVNTAA